MFLYNFRRLGYLGGQAKIKKDRFLYTHGIYECASQYLTVLNYLDNLDKCDDFFREIIPNLEKVVNNENINNNDIIKISDVTDYYSLDDLVMKIFPAEIYEIKNIIRDMNSVELKNYIDNIETKFDVNENIDVIIAYLNYQLDEKMAYEHYIRFVPTYEERAMSRADYNIICKVNDAARAYAIERASKVRM